MEGEGEGGRYLTEKGERLLSRGESELEEELKAQLYKKCWQECQHQNSSSQEAVLALINDQFDLAKHADHCR